MRILLAAMNCPKGEVRENVVRHVEVLREAARQGCDIAVYPEMSLTGSVNPASQRDRAVTLQSEPVLEVARQTAETGVAAVFGIAEQGDDQTFITQVVAEGGKVVGSYRKRHLGEGEESFTPGSSSALFRLGETRFGVAICAEGGVDYPFTEPARKGAQVVFFCAAPGLNDRCTDEAGWRAGFDWWEPASLGDATRHARRLGIWVALATQAGSTVDEDFPGLAALIDPTGSVVARLPDWRPGTLVVDIP